METDGQSRIPARNRRQTMDWALVLMSQGIAATIDDGADGAGWCLWVDPADYPAARRAIRLYQWENRHWHWRQPLPWRGFHFDWKSAFWGLFLVVIHGVSQISDRNLQTAWRMDNAAVRAGEWWRLFTAMLLHADVSHLLSNVTLGMLLLGLVMGRYGSGTALLAAYLAGAAGNLAGLLLYPTPHFGVGASGMVMGALGMLAVQSLTLLRHGGMGRKHLFRGLITGVILLALFGLNPDTDVLAHCTGFVTGVLLGSILVSLPARWRTRTNDTIAGVAFLGLLVVTGWLAFR